MIKTDSEIRLQILVENELIDLIKYIDIGIANSSSDIIHLSILSLMIYKLREITNVSKLNFSKLVIND